MYEAQIASLQKLLGEKAEPKAKEWWEAHVKGSAPFRGVRMPAIRSVLRGWHREQIAQELDFEQQVGLALALFREPYSEDKLAGTLFLAEILLPQGALDCARDVERFAELFASGSIDDWNVCDWFCVKVLGPLIERQGEPCARRIAAWHSAENLWQARASVVAFVKVAEQGAYYPLVRASCQTLIRREERFAKTAVGWILREISKHDLSFVNGVIEEELAHFTVESLRNASKYLPQDEADAYAERLRTV
jgi:3-methyladenine DNA glycosylase AlkD